MLMFAVTFVAGAEMTSRSDLLTSAADLAAATTERVIGAVSSGFWSAMPQATKEITVEVGTKLVFKWSGGHDLVFTGKDVWDTCGLAGGSNYKCVAAEPNTMETCDGGDELSLGADNLYKYEAVVKNEGEYYFTCSQPGHCGAGQKVKVTVAPAGTAAVSSPPPAALPADSKPPPTAPLSAGDDDAVCFGRERTAACRLLDRAASAAAAHSACWGAASPAAGGPAAATAAAALVSMSELVAGDLVLTEKGGAPSIDRVVVNQHREASLDFPASATLLTLVHAAGALTLTPNHVVWLDGGFHPARAAAVGSTLSNGLTVTAITKHVGGIVNPIVAGGTILASDKAGGGPVLAATADECMVDVLLSAYPKYSPSCALAAAFPAAAQAYYDDALEPLFNAAVPTLATLKAAAPAPLVGLALVAGDAALAAGLGAYVLGCKGVATLAAVAAAAAALAFVAARRTARK